MSTNANNKFQIKVTGDTVEIERSMKTVNTLLSAAKRESVAFNKSLKDDPTSIETLNKHLEATERAFTLSTEKVKILKEQLSNVDKDVDPSKFSKLSSEIIKAESETKKLEGVMSSTASRIESVKRLGSTFQINVNGNVKEFTNTVQGVSAALSTLKHDNNTLINFDASTASASKITHVINDLDSAIDLSNRKATLLRDELSRITPTVDSKAFTKLNNELRATESEIEKLSSKSETLKSSFNNLSSSNVSNALTPFKNVGATLNNAFAGVGSAVTSVTSSFSKILSAITSVTSRVSEIGTAFKSVASVIGSVMSSAASLMSSAIGKATSSIIASARGLGEKLKEVITAPLSAAAGAFKSGFNSIIQGGLLTIGNQLTTGAQSLARGIISSLNETVQASKSLTSVLSFAGVDTSTIETLKTDMGEYAKSTSYGASEMNKIVSSLSASNVQASQAGTLAKNIGNAYALLGDGTRKLDDIGLIFAQINSATKLQAQDYHQLLNAGIGSAIKQDIEKNYPDIIAAYGDFSNAMQHSAISAEMVNQAVSRIGSTDAAQKAASVPKTIKAAMDSLNETISQKFQSTFDVLNTKGINSIQNITSKIETLNVSAINDKIAKAIEASDGVTQSLANVFNTVDWSSVFGSLFSIFNTIKQSIADVNFSNIANTAKNAFDVVANTINATFANLDISTIINDIVNVISSLVAVFGRVTSSAGYVEFLKFINTITTLSLNTLNDFITKLANIQINADLSNVLNGVLDIVNNIIAALNNIDISAVFSSIASLATPIIDVFKTLTSSTTVTALGSSIASVFGLAKTAIEAVAESIKGINFTSLGSGFSSIVDGLSAILSRIDFTAVFNALSSGIGAVLSTIGNVIASIDFSAVFNSISAIVSNLSTVFGNIFKNIDFNDVLSGISSIVTTLFNVFQAFTQLLADLSASEIVQNLVNFVGVGISSVIASIQQIGPIISSISESFKAFTLSEDFANGLSVVVDIFSNLFEIVSNIATALLTIGENIASAFIVNVNTSWISGIGDALRSVVQFVNDLTAGFANFVNATKDGAFQTFSGIIGSLVDVFSSLAEVLSSFLANVFQPFAQTLSNMAKSELFAQLTASLTELGANIGTAFTELGKALQTVFKFLKPVTDLLGKIIGWVTSGIFAGFVVAFQSVIEVINDVFSALESVIKSIIDLTSGVGNAIWSVISAIFENFSDDFGGASSNFSNFSNVSSFSDSVSNYSAITSNVSKINNINVNVNSNSQSATDLARIVAHEVANGLV